MSDAFRREIDGGWLLALCWFLCDLKGLKRSPLLAAFALISLAPYVSSDQNLPSYLNSVLLSQGGVRGIPQHGGKKVGMMMMGGMPYQFSYGVNDESELNIHSRTESSDGTDTIGEYRVLLPNGQTQIVQYTSNAETGFLVEIKYENDTDVVTNLAQPMFRPHETLSNPKVDMVLKVGTKKDQNMLHNNQRCRVMSLRRLILGLTLFNDTSRNNPAKTSTAITDKRVPTEVKAMAVIIQIIPPEHPINSLQDEVDQSLPFDLHNNLKGLHHSVISRAKNQAEGLPKFSADLQRVMDYLKLIPLAKTKNQAMNRQRVMGPHKTIKLRGLGNRQEVMVFPKPILFKMRTKTRLGTHFKGGQNHHQTFKSQRPVMDYLKRIR
eukprot:TCALIF_09718-PA protein Name:"Protein of unknown function" AED:0.29 eAED:0.29 QI:0/0.33/0/0.75/1/1/4/0/378